MPSTETVSFRGKKVTVGKRLYVGNLSWQTRWQSLKDHANKFGQVVHASVMSQSDGRSAGCGIVEFEDARTAARAMKEMHDTYLDDRQIWCREDKDDYDLGGRGSGGRAYQEPYSGGKGRGWGGGGGKRGGGKGKGGGGYGRRDRDREYYSPRRATQYDDKVLKVRIDGELVHVGRRVYVGNLAWRVSWQQLKDMFSEQIGPVVYADVFRYPDGRSRGAGIVEFEKPGDAKRAILQMQEVNVGGRYIFVREDREDRMVDRR